MKNPFWTSQIPVWVSRKTADGDVSQFTAPGWTFMLLGALAVFNALAWGLIGLVTAAQLVVGAIS